MADVLDELIDEGEDGDCEDRPTEWAKMKAREVVPVDYLESFYAWGTGLRLEIMPRGHRHIVVAIASDKRGKTYLFWRDRKTDKHGFIHNPSRAVWDEWFGWVQG